MKTRRRRSPRCPRELPISHIMYGLANYAQRIGIASKLNPL